MRKRQLIFLYRKSRVRWGSTTMRGQQLAQLIAPYLQDVDVQTQVFSRHECLQALWARFVPRGSVIFATKDVTQVFTPGIIDILHQRDCRICFDVVDTRISDLPGPGLPIDCFIASALAGISFLENHINKVYAKSSWRPAVLPVLHNADLRLYSRSVVEKDCPRTVYWGDINNAFVTPAIARQVDLLDGADSISFERTLGEVLQYNVHYAVRVTEEARIKPFTKGFNAAVLGAIIFVDRMVPDATELLGEDYPFLLPSNDEATVLRGLQHLQESYGGPDWAIAKQRCADLAHRVSPEALAGQFRNVINAVCN